MSVSKLTIAGLCAQAAISATLIIISMMSGAGLHFYLLAAAYILTGLFFLEPIYTSVHAPVSRCASALEPAAQGSGRQISDASPMEAGLEGPASGEASRMELDRLLNALNVGVLDIDMDGRVTSANEAALAIFEQHQSEMSGRLISSFIAKECLADADDLICKTLSGRRVNTRELSLVSKSGEARAIEFTMASKRKYGDITGCRCIAIDMTRSRALETALQEARASSEYTAARLEKAEKDLEEFALIAIRREVKMREIRERLQSHAGSFKL